MAERNVLIKSLAFAEFIGIGCRDHRQQTIVINSLTMASHKSSQLFKCRQTHFSDTQYKKYVISTNTNVAETAAKYMTSLCCAICLSLTNDGSTHVSWEVRRDNTMFNDLTELL